jgi:hypothetical protein
VLSELVLVLLNEDSDGWRLSWGVRYGICELLVVEPSELDSVGARLRVSDAMLCARASSMTSGSSSVMPFSISAKMAMVSLNCVSVRLAVEKRAYSY